jgi:NitT/TauT family transport system ATP-binding protein
MSFECRKLSKLFPTRDGRVAALRDATFRVEEHEFVCVVGPSGCGKTTLLRLLSGLLQPTSGEIVFDGPLRDGRPHAALVFQQHALFPWMTTLDNVAFGLEMQGVDRVVRRRRAMDMIREVGLGPFAERYPHELSLGMQQRANLARAFLADPDILLMDEPLGSLDAQTKLLLQQELLRIWKERRKIVLYVTHDIREAVLLGDRVLVMSGHPGTIREEIQVPLGRPRDLTYADTPEAMRIVRHIWTAIEDEVRSSAWQKDRTQSPPTDRTDEGAG